MATPVVLTTGARPIIPVESGGVPMTPVDTLGEPVTVVDTLGEPVVLINNDGTPAFLAYSAKTYLGGVAPYHWLDFIANRALYASVDVGDVTQATGYSFTRASDGYYTNSDGTLTLFGSGALRRGDRGVLIEGSRTNLILRSQEFNNASWSKLTSAISGTFAAPDGTTTAQKLVGTVGSTNIRLSQALSLTGLTTYTYSIFAKAAEYTTLRAGRIDTNINAFTHDFDLSAGSASGGGVIAALGNGWYRCSGTIVCNTTASTGVVFTAQVGATANGTDGLLIWGAQLEAGAFPSSYIPTVAAASTRAADVLTYTAGVSYPLQLWSEFERAVDTGGTATILQTRAADNNNRARLNVAGGVAAGLVTASGSAQAQPAVAGALAINTVYKTALRVDTNNVNMARDGTLGTNDTSATLPDAPTLLMLGSDGSLPLFGYIRRVAVIQGAGTDANLIAMTS